MRYPSERALRMAKYASAMVLLLTLNAACAEHVSIGLIVEDSRYKRVLMPEPSRCLLGAVYISP
ncbi:MAG: hypothetical protein IPK60_17065 [Sandaracinaceae bacterium]|nr:hypothetical protein [Sandaracinaceae bacterium]